MYGAIPAWAWAPTWAVETGKMGKDAFSKCHPLVSFLFFVGAFACIMVIQHPAYLLAGLVSGAVYYLFLTGAKGLKLLLGLLPLFVFITVVNPLFNTQGQWILFYLFGRPYTAQALAYGAVVAAVFLSTAIWFGCFSRVLTSDKFTALFANLIPAVSLLLVMVLRLVPGLMGKLRQITGARSAIGKGSNKNAALRDKLSDGMTVLGALTSWALEGGVVTGDSMRARGYGAAKRSSFAAMHLTARDWLLLGALTVLAGIVIAAAALGGTQAVFVPQWHIASISGLYSLGFAAYCIYLLIPVGSYIKERVQWYISRSRI